MPRSPRPLALRADLRARRRHDSDRERSRSATLIFFSSNVLLFWYAFRFHADAIVVRGSAWGGCFPAPLRLGQLFRCHRPGAGLELLPISCSTPSGPPAFWPDRRRRIAGIDWRGPSRSSAGSSDWRRRQHDARARGTHPGCGRHRVDGPHPTTHRRWTGAACPGSAPSSRRQPQADCRNAVSPVDCDDGISGGHHDAVDRLSAEPGRVATVP